MFITGGAEGCVCEEATFDVAAADMGRGLTGRRKVKVKSLSRVRRCDPMFCSPPGSSIQGIFQARILEWVAVSSPGGHPDPGMESGSPTLQADSRWGGGLLGWGAERRGNRDQSAATVGLVGQPRGLASAPRVVGTMVGSG